jgi:hypothetical protein
VTKISKLNRLPHFLFVTIVQNIEHLFGVVIIDLHSAKMDSFGCELSDLLLNKPTFGISLRIIITTGCMILISMTRSICNQNSVLAL